MWSDLTKQTKKLCMEKLRSTKILFLMASKVFIILSKMSWKVIWFHKFSCMISLLIIWASNISIVLSHTQYKYIYIFKQWTITFIKQSNNLKGCVGIFIWTVFDMSISLWLKKCCHACYYFWVWTILFTIEPSNVLLVNSYYMYARQGNVIKRSDHMYQGSSCQFLNFILRQIQRLTQTCRKST